MAILQLGREFAPLSAQVGGSIGQSLGTGLSGVLQHLATQKMQDISTRKQAQGIKALFPNISEEQAVAYAQNPELAKLYYKSELTRPTEESYARMLGGEQPGQAQNQFNLPSLSQFLSPEQQQSRGITPEINVPQQPQLLKSQGPAPRLTERQLTKLKEFGLKEKEIKQRADIAEQRGKALKEAEESKAKRIKQHEINKETLPTYEETNKHAKVADVSDRRLNRMEKLNNEGHLGIPIVNSALRALSKGIFGFGLDLTSLMTADAQELDKLSTDFIKDAKDIFGARITDADLDAFMRTIPTLAQSKEGRAKLISNLRMFNEAGRIRKSAMDKIIKANNDERPAHLDSLIEEAIAPQLDELARRFESQPTGIRIPEKEPNILSKVGSSLAQTLGLMY